jgi:putative colanic acid biosynthesis glycosyltransferase WcaI
MKHCCEPPANTEVARAKVAVVTAYFWPEQLGCAPYMTDLANHLAMSGHAVDVLTAEPHYPRKCPQFATDSRRQGSLPALTIRRARIFDRSSGRLGIRLLNDLSFALQAAVAAATRHRDWTAAVVLAPSVLAVPSLRLMRPRIRLVTAVYDIESGLARATGLVRYPWAGWLLDAVERWCLNRADAIVVLTPQMKAALVAIGVARPIHVVPIWPLVEPQPRRPRDGRSMKLMYSGGLTRRHGAHLLPSLWRHLRRRMADCRLIVQGDGEERDAILHMLAADGDRVIVRQSVERRFLASRLAEADLQLVLQANNVANFTMPSKAVTCLAAGVPFLTNAPVGSPLAEFAVASGGGHVVPGGASADLAEAAAALLAAPQELSAMAQRGMAYVQRHHDPAGLLQRYDALLFARAQADIADDARWLSSKAAEP